MSYYNTNQLNNEMQGLNLKQYGNYYPPQQAQMNPLVSSRHDFTSPGANIWNSNQEIHATQPTTTYDEWKYSKGYNFTPSTGTTINGSVATEISDDEVQRLKLQLRAKDAQVEILENEVKKLASIQVASKPSSQPVTQNVYALFQKLSQALKDKECELQETKLRLESLVTAVSLNPSHSVTKYGRYDEEMTAHKILTKLEVLTSENADMAKMLSYGKSKEFQIEIALLRKENADLKSRLEETQ